MNPTRRDIALAAGLFAALGLAVVLLRPVLPIDETRYLTAAWEMWQGGSWIVPHVNGAVYDHKPPLLFWLINGAWALTGGSEIAARMVAPAFGALSVALTGLLSLRLWPGQRSRAVLAALILATGGVFLSYGTGTMFDTMLTAATLSALLALIAMRRADGWGPVLGLGAAIAFGVYAKGPVILVHVLPAAFVMPFLGGSALRPALGRWYGRIGLAVLIALALVLVWLGPALVLGGAEYRADVLWRQSAGRMVAAFAHERPIWFFAILIPVYLWPWGLTREGLAALSPRTILRDPSARLVAVWAASAFVVFSLISGKQAHYLMPEMPALALLVAGGGLPGRGRRWPLLVLLLPAAGVLAAAGLIAAGRMPDLPVNGAAIGWGAVAMAAAILGAVAWALIRPAKAWPGVALVAPATVVMLLAAAHPLLMAGYDPHPLGALVKANEAAGTAITDPTYHGQFNWAGGLARPVDRVPDAAQAAAWIGSHPGGLLLTRKAVDDPRLTRTGIRQFHGKTYILYVVGTGP